MPVPTSGAAPGSSGAAAAGSARPATGLLTQPSAAAGASRRSLAWRTARPTRFKVSVSWTASVCCQARASSFEVCQRGSVSGTGSSPASISQTSSTRSSSSSPILMRCSWRSSWSSSRHSPGTPGSPASLMCLRRSVRASSRSVSRLVAASKRWLAGSSASATAAAFLPFDEGELGCATRGLLGGMRGSCSALSIAETADMPGPPPYPVKLHWRLLRATALQLHMAMPRSRD
mmetsp:Transcript_55338/g.157552  ORF Transcript_55338/g.157552 Transcript_55338/m.157552 type:complete len:232 (-) Transcript_55338:749-1444(-)